MSSDTSFYRDIGVYWCLLPKASNSFKSILTGEEKDICQISFVFCLRKNGHPLEARFHVNNEIENMLMEPRYLRKPTDFGW